LDPLLTHAVRFSIVAALNGIQHAEFAAIRDGVEISDAMLSKQVALLEGAGYVQVHVAALRAIAGFAG
jgi:DNA-binding HxlR family transcriptional regulator